MNHGTGDGGWCPVDDRVYEGTGGVCPDCGTALVDTAPRMVEAEAIPAERPGSGSLVARAAIAGAVVGAFILGLSFQRGKDEGSPRATPSPAAVSRDVHVGTVVHADSGDLRLNRFVQERDAFTATFTSGKGFPDPQFVRGVAVEVSTVRDGTPEVFGVSDVQLTRLDAGFMVQGHMPDRSGRITEIRLSSVQITVSARPEWRIDLGGIWPVRGPEPAVLHVGEGRTVGSGAIRLVSIVSWKDRLEVAFELRGLRAGDTGTFAINEIEIETLRGSGVDRNGTSSVLAATVQEQIAPAEIVARFEGLPPGVGIVTIRAARLSRFLAGPWTWGIA
jgi:hypothetical protein